MRLFKRGGGGGLIVDSMTADELKLLMQNKYSLGGCVAERIHFSYKMHTSGRNKKLLFLKKMVTSVRIFNSKMLMDMKNWCNRFNQGASSDDSC